MDNTNIYIGNRYVPVFADPIEWSASREYEPLTIVLHNGFSYTSKKIVPLNTDISNTEFWALTGNYNAQIEQYRQDVADLSDDLNTLSDSTNTRFTQVNQRIDGQASDISENQNDISEIQGDISDIESDFATLQANLNTLTHNFNMANDFQTIVCIGDSYLEGYNPQGYANGWGYYLAPLLKKTLNATLKRYYKGGSGFGQAVDGINFNSLVNTAYSDIGATEAANVGAVVIVGGANEPTSMGSSVGTTLQNARSKFPNAKIFYAYGSNYKDQSCYNRPAVTAAYQAGAQTVADCYYLGDLTTMLKSNPAVYSSDGVHLTASGYMYLAWAIANAMAGHRISFNRVHRTWDTNFMEYITNDTYVFELFNPKAYTISVSDHIANGDQLLYTINHDTYIQADESLFFVADTNGYIKTSDDKFHAASFVLRLYPDRVEVYDYAIAADGTNYVTGTITAFQIKPFMVALPVSII